MSYEPTKWQTGDIITLNKLNKLEQGVAAMMEEYQPTVWQIGDTVTSTKLNKLEQAVATLSENCGTSLGKLVGVKVHDADTFMYVSTTPYDIMSGETSLDVEDSIYNNTNVLRMQGMDAALPSGYYVVIRTEVSNVWTTDSLSVRDDDSEQQITSGFECRVFNEQLYGVVFFTMQIPAGGLIVSFDTAGEIG